MFHFFRNRKSRKNALALSGGAVLGAAHIGVLKALDEFDVSINYVSGTSIGAFVGALYAFDKTWDEIYEITKSLNWLEVSSLSLSEFGILSNKKMGNILIKSIGYRNFSDASVPLSVVATDISDGSKVILNEGNVSEAVMASTCIPGIFKPIEVDGRLLVDGGVVENVPVSPFESCSVDTVIAVDLLLKHSGKRPTNIVEVILNTFDFMIINNSKYLTGKADISIKPDLSGFNKIDTHQFSDLFETGYVEAKRVLSRYKKKL